jgi:hypothetical protein
MMLRIPDCLDNRLTDGSTHRPRFYFLLLILISVTGSATPRVYGGRMDSVNGGGGDSIHLIWSRTRDLRLVALRLNQLVDSVAPPKWGEAGLW